MTFHVLGLHHTICSDEFSSCAFTGKVRRLPAVLPADKHVIVYTNEIAEADMRGECATIQIRSRADLEARFGAGDALTNVQANNASQDSIDDFGAALLVELRARVVAGDFVLHTVGTWHASLVEALPHAIHVESGIGYMSGPFGAYRIFESEAWRHWHFGRYHDAAPMRATFTGGPNAYENTFVAPNYYDVDEWPLGTGAGGYVAFAGRLVPEKGIAEFVQLARLCPTLEFRVAGRARDRSVEALLCEPNIVVEGELRGRDRARYFGEARCVVTPSRYVEPFCGVAVEAMLCGTPVVAPAVGAFTEHVENAPAPCYTARTLRDFLVAIADEATADDRQRIQAFARNRYSLSAVSVDYADAFDQLAERP